MISKSRICLGKPADLYLENEYINDYLDSKQCLVAGKVNIRFINNTKKTGFVEEDLIIMANYQVDRVIIFEGVQIIIYKLFIGELNVFWNLLVLDFGEITTIFDQEFINWNRLKM